MREQLVYVEVERDLRRLAEELTAVRPGECVLCFVARMIDGLGCDRSLRFARRYRDRCAPRAVALERRFGQVGGFCDCEIFLNGYRPHPSLWSPAKAYAEVPTRDDAESAGGMPACPTVRRGSTQPCWMWVRRSRDTFDLR